MKKTWLIVTIMAVFIFASTAAVWASEPIKLVVNGQEIKPDVAPQIINNRTMVPVRWIAEALGAHVEWDPENQMVLIITDTNITDNQNNSDQTAIIKVVEDFGSKMKNVSLLAPEDVVSKSLQENYGDLVALELLAKWQKDPTVAPGRLTSSPWPERIEIIETHKISDSKYQIKGEIIEVTSVEMANGGYAAKQPVILVVEKIDNNWLITAFELNEYDTNNSIIYINTQYGFSFELPESWQGYKVITEQWEGLAIGSPDNTPIHQGPLFLIRHPNWTSENPHQDIPIMVFTHAEWDSLEQGEFHIGAAPIGPKELGRNSQYIFALPARYNFSFPEGHEEVEQILDNNPVKPLEGNIIKPELAKKVIKESADKVIYAISTKDAVTIADYTHPVKGVRFTPYTNVSLENDLVFSKDAIKNFFTDQKTYLWGYYDGSGEDIKLTPSQYFDKFVYDVDYINAEEIGYNEVLGTGNAVENQFEIYKNAIVVEYYFPGFTPEYDGLDWKSLRLVFEPYENDWKLVGIISNQWTI